jgi:hypothetical protein
VIQTGANEDRGGERKFWVGLATMYFFVVHFFADREISVEKVLGLFFFVCFGIGQTLDAYFLVEFG